MTYKDKASYEASPPCTFNPWDVYTKQPCISTKETFIYNTAVYFRQKALSLRKKSPVFPQKSPTHVCA